MRTGIPQWRARWAMAFRARSSATLLGLPAATSLALSLATPLALSLPLHASANPGSATHIDLGRISVADLSRDAAAWVILDGRPGDSFRSGHLPGAQSFSWEDHTRTDERGVPYQPLPLEQLAAALGAMGLSETTPVVVYGDADKSWGGEGWACWTLEWIGHQGPVRLLDGGVHAWRAADLPFEKGNARPPQHPATYVPRLRPELDVSTPELRQHPQDLAIVDTRTSVERLLGKIPGSIHIPWNEFHHGGDRRPIDPGELRALLEAKGVNPEQPVVYYCTGGVRSAYAWMVHELSGLPDARNYEGGMEEWKRIK